MGPGALIATVTILGLLGFAVGSSSGGQLPTAAQVMLAMCQALADRGELAPLPDDPIAEQDLAIKALTQVLRLGGSWPPGSNASAPRRDLWSGSLLIARRVRNGEIHCEDGGGGENDGNPPEPGPGPEPLPPPPPVDQLPALSTVKLMICELLMGFADPASAYLEIGKLEPQAAQDVAASAMGKAGYVGTLPPPADASDARKGLWLAALAFALSVIEGQESCGIANKLITINQPRGPGGFVQIEGDVPNRTDELDDLNSLADLYPGMKQASIAARLELMRAINNHAYNAGLLIPAVKASTKQNIGPMVISFNPKWRENPRTIMERFESGSSFGVPFLPLVKATP
jgi:hypothetical protein